MSPNFTFPSEPQVQCVCGFPFVSLVDSVVVWSMRSSMYGMLFIACSSALSVFMFRPNSLAVVWNSVYAFRIMCELFDRMSMSSMYELTVSLSVKAQNFGSVCNMMFR